MKYTIRTLITRGSNHDLHCEDDYYVNEDENWLIAAVFDGCSSGVESHYASTCHKHRLKEILKYINLYYEETPDLSQVTKKLIFGLYVNLHNEDYSSGEEMLSTVILLLVNKLTKQYYIIFMGDGVCKIDEHIINVHDSQGDKVWYLSTIDNYKDFNEYYELCPKYGGNELPENLIISTDGIDSFKDMYGVDKSKEVREIFFNSERFMHQETMLKRLYNIITKNNNPPCKNQDDFTMIRIKIEKENGSVELHKKCMETLQAIC